MKRVKSQLSLGLVCIILGLMLTFQFRATSNTIGVTKERQIRDISKEIDDLKKQKGDMDIKLQDSQKKIDDYEKAAASQSGTAKMMKDEIDKLRFLSGLVDVEGIGIVITITPATDIETRKTFPLASDQIISIINELNSGGAEAISINDERYVGRTQIRDIGSNIKINDTKFDASQVMTIKVIGDPDIMNSVFKLPDGIVEEMRSTGIEVSIKPSKSVTILKYNKNLDYKYMKSIGR